MPNTDTDTTFTPLSLKLYRESWIRRLAANVLYDNKTDKIIQQRIRMYLFAIPKKAKSKYIPASCIPALEELIDANYHIKCHMMPTPKEEYTKDERLAINKGIRQLEQSMPDDHFNKKFVLGYLYHDPIKKNKNKNKQTANKLNLGVITIAAQQKDK